MFWCEKFCRASGPFAVWDKCCFTGRTRRSCVAVSRLSRHVWGSSQPSWACLTALYPLRGRLVCFLREWCTSPCGVRWHSDAAAIAASSPIVVRDAAAPSMDLGRTSRRVNAGGRLRSRFTLYFAPSSCGQPKPEFKTCVPHPRPRRVLLAAPRRPEAFVLVGIWIAPWGISNFRISFITVIFCCQKATRIRPSFPWPLLSLSSCSTSS
ncbi:hypothetical protein B0H12DRAFT_373204 [Mycena haematopus]|nr:hypothetical protein B0H12DRAFT_373204 [Mycena haematopus]